MDSSIFGCDDIFEFIDSIFYQLLIKFIRHKHPVCVSSILGMFSTLVGYHEYIGGYHDVCGGYHEYIGGCSVHHGFQNKLKGFCPPHAS